MQTLNGPAEMLPSGEKAPEGDLPIIVIGTGPVGIRMVQELRREDPDCRIELFGDEPWEPHDRVKLSSFLASGVASEERDPYSGLPEDAGFRLHSSTQVMRIDRARKAIVTRYDEVFRYRSLILATGSQPLIPDIPGIGLESVYTFRDVIDTHRLTRKSRRRHGLVLGGGLLGLECARAMPRIYTRVTVIDPKPHLLYHRLDSRGAALLRRHLEGQGINFIVDDPVAQILGGYGVQGVELSSGLTLRCDTLILAVGTTPNVELASEAGLKVNRGVLVDDRLETSDASIFAVGECAEHRGEIYALFLPGYEQARVAARVVLGCTSVYAKPKSMMEQRVAGVPVFNYGDVTESDGRLMSVFVDEEVAIYRKLIVERGRLIGAMALGPWPEIPQLREAIEQRRHIKSWQLWRFRKSGSLWRDAHWAALRQLRWVRS